jgi:polyisoprenoid-binding protein YceI
VPTLKKKHMKIINFIAISVATAALASFQLVKTDLNTKPNNTYKLDKANSILGWKGGKSDAYFHTGTVKFSEGSVIMNKSAISSGKFTVDLGSIAVVDANLPKEKQEGLAKHLMTEDFFNVAKFATSTVTIGEYKDGKLATTISLLGVEVKKDIPVEIIASKGTITIKGKFDVDFSAAKIPGTQPIDGEKEFISPNFSFDLNLVMKGK